MAWDDSSGLEDEVIIKQARGIHNRSFRCEILRSRDSRDPFEGKSRHRANISAEQTERIVTSPVGDWRTANGRNALGIHCDSAGIGMMQAGHCYPRIIRETSLPLNPIQALNPSQTLGIETRACHLRGAEGVVVGKGQESDLHATGGVGGVGYWSSLEAGLGATSSHTLMVEGGGYSVARVCVA